MASEKYRVNKWLDRIRAANNQYKKWDKRYDTSQLEEYYLGRQWRGLKVDEADKRYVINLVFSTMETNKPSLIFNNPFAKIEPRPGKEDDLSSEARARAVLCQDTVQTFIDDPDVGFIDETSLALHEAHFRFGVIEVGYTADWVGNPEAGKPVLREKTKEEDPDAYEKDSEGEDVIGGPVVIKSEELYLKRIPASTYRVSISNKNKISRNDWVGYYEWHYVEDIKDNPVYKKGAKGLKATGSLASDVQDETDNDDPDLMERHNGMVRVWKVWDLRTKKRHVVAEGHDKFLQEGEPFKFLPHAVIRFYDILESFYPCPPVYQWLGPQDEVNETRDAQRAHRRRFYRRYTRMSGAIDDDELEKLETGGDGVCAISNVPNPLSVVPDAPLGADVWQHLDASKVDFLTVSGVSGDQRGVAESETATQASIIDAHARLRESAIRAKVQRWLAEVARLVLLTIREDMALPFWVQRNVDNTAAPINQGIEVLRVAKLWEEITSEDLGNTDMDVDIDLSTMSPVAQESERNSWNMILNLMANPQMAMILGMSPALLRKTLTLYGIRNQSEIAEIQQVLQNILLMQAAQAAAAGAEKGPDGAGAPAGEGGNSIAGETPAELGGGMIQ